MKKALHAFANWLGFSTFQRLIQKPARLLITLGILAVLISAWVHHARDRSIRPRSELAQGRSLAQETPPRETEKIRIAKSAVLTEAFALITPAVQELDRLLRRGDLCGFLDEWRTNQVDGQELATLLPSAGDSALRMDRALLSGDSKSFRSLASQSETAQFIQALNVGGVFPFSETESERSENTDQSFEILTNLMRAHPDNGAYAAYRAVIRAKRGDASSEIQKDLVDASEAPEFETHLRSLTRPLFEWALQSPAHYFAGITLLATLPIANYNQLLAVVRQEVNAGGDEFAARMERFGRTILRSQNATEDGREFVDWIAIEYQIGLHIARVGWSKNHPNEMLPSELQKTYRDLIKPEASREVWDPIFSPDWSCDPVRAGALLDYEIQRVRERRG